MKLDPELCPHCGGVVREHVWDCGCAILPYQPRVGLSSWLIRPCGKFDNMRPETIRGHLGSDPVVEAMLNAWERDRK